MKKILFTGARSGISNAVIERIKNKNFEIYLTVHIKSPFFLKFLAFLSRKTHFKLLFFYFYILNIPLFLI